MSNSLKTKTTTAQLSKVNAFLQIAAGNPDLESQLAAINNENIFYQKTAQVAADLGFSFIAADVEGYYQQKREAAAIFSYGEEVDVVAGSIVAGGCPGPITTICAVTGPCWTSLC